MFAALIGLSAGIMAADTALVVRAVRFYRADPRQSPGQTQVTALIRLPPQLPQAGPTGEVSLIIAVRVVEADGDTLYQQGWRKRTAVPFPRGAADRLDLLRFTIGAGSYRLEVSAEDSVSGRRVAASVPVDAYSEPPPASDLMVSPWLRPVATVDTIPQPGEFRRGGLIVAIAPDVVVGGATASVAYLFETYAGTAAEANLTMSVIDEAGVSRKRVGPTPVAVAAGIGLLTGQLEVGDLSAGHYRLVASLAIGEQVIERDARFEVDPTVASAPAALSDLAFFGGLGGGALDQAFAPLAAIAAGGDLSGWPVLGSDQNKREFLERFWRARDGSPRSTGNERRAQFYDGVIYANAFYAEPLLGLAGWQTSRGRVFLRQGLPPQVLRRPRRGSVPAYEVWRYFEPVGWFYVFVDRGLQGGYVLVRSNDPRETKEARWQELLTPTGVREVVGFLGRSVLAEQ